MYSHNVPWKSDTKLITPGHPMDFFDFVPLVGPKGGRVVVDTFVVVITGVITVAVANWDGRDVSRLIDLLDVQQRDGRSRWLLSGYKSRIMSIMLNGIEQHQEHGNVNIAAGAAVDLRLVIPMAKRFTRRPKDFSLPADVFRKISINWAALANAGAGATLSAATLSAYILAEWHEEDSVEIKSEDVVKTADFTTNTQAKLALNGTVHDLFLVKQDATAGGASVAAITDARIEDLGTPVLTRQDLVHSYRAKRGIAASGPTTPGTERFLEPVQQGSCLPLIVSCPETSVWEGKMLDSMKIDVGTGTAGLSCVTREIVDKSQAIYNATCARFGIAPAAIRMKTDKKSRTGMNDGWSQRQKLVAPWKAPLRQAA